MKATLYIRPDGRKKVIDIRDIDPEDEKWFLENNVKISLEEIAGNAVAFYADYGKVIDGDPDEVIVIANPLRESCEDSLKKLRELTEQKKTTLL